MRISILFAVLAIAAAIGFAVMSTDDSDACTGFYVGSEVSESGNTLIGQTADCLPCVPACYTHHDAVKGVKGRTIEGVAGFVYQLPEDTYDYSCSLILYTDRGISCFGAGSTNECGLAFTGAITGMSNEDALNADPLVPDGIGEDALSMIMGACASSAREGVGLTVHLIKTYGSSECNMFLFADKEEAWYMEVYTGHQYCAIRLPADKASVFGNEFSIMYLSEYDGMEIIRSEELLTLPEEKGFAVHGPDGELSIIGSYAIPYDDYSHMRTWIGHHVLSPDTYPAEYDRSEVYDLLFTPDHKVSVKEVMDLTRNRYEGTEYCPDEEFQQVRTIGVESTSEAHILEVDPSLPDDMCITRWLCIGPSVYGVYFPVSSLASEYYEPFTKMDYSYTLENDSVYVTFKMLNTVCSEQRYSDASSYAEKDMVSEGVAAYWSALEQYHIDIWPKVIERAKALYAESSEKAKDYLNSYAVGVEKDIYDEAKAILDGTLFGIAEISKCSDERHPFRPYVDVAIYGKRYGWDSSVEGNTITLTRGDENVTFSVERPDISYTGKMFYGGIARVISMHMVGDSFRVNWQDARVIEDMGGPVVVDYPMRKDSSGNGADPVPVIAVVAVVVAIAAAVLLYYRRR